MEESLLTDKGIADFEKWAKTEDGFSYNRYTKQLIYKREHFWEFDEMITMQFIQKWLDSNEVYISVEPTYWDGRFAGFSKNVNNKFPEPTNRVVFISRSEAMRHAIQEAIKIHYNGN